MKRDRKMESYPTNPFVPVWPKQDVMQAIEHHIRTTGHQGPFLVRFMDAPAAELPAAA